ncbi:lipoyl(octanoyl) transferase LipB [Morganella morganii]|uniref:lipoyl(octanoyl) transferase LipB n=1 Tax=Morganella morganii TaxID=582 RepID=UPI000C79FFA4|nr:lipoyl(octanoyl) transferase LipB [Morganella morganii]EGT3609193.1 lipoyl(octanoyl) transferase LipB [Morganella morganii]MBC4003550.1 lipoyl(octanoyl) transferase LipB [Morganella morganii]MBT0354667.1 lipoyl(octanoyl) transferase LipB [Morganella morganii subsp. morganii]MDI9763137.1 lipoyl(octanoyl) transferase LipB [Morganella morganii]PLA33053.1 octanoyltransferase [Morganella morganii]
MQNNTIILRQLGLRPYHPVSEAMHQFTEQRTAETGNEIWLVEHERVFTQGQAGKAEHVLAPGDIPVIQSDRGGQVTYHGPGQQVMYVMIDLKRDKIGVRELVSALENSVVETLKQWNIDAYPRPDAPGVYVAGNKICSLGLRIRNGRSFHGLALNINMDLEPFHRINPCGYAGLAMTQMADFVTGITLADVQPVLTAQFCRQLGFQLAAE